MITSYIQQFDTLQQYLTSLFDSFQYLDLTQIIKQSNNSVKQSQLADIIQLTISYGRKIIEISQKSTYQYRNQYFLQRKNVEEDLKKLYFLIINEEIQESYEQIIQDLVVKLKTQRKSIIHRITLPESRLTHTDTKHESKRIHQRQSVNQQKIIYEDRALNEDQASYAANRNSSKVKSKVSKVTSVKQVLKIKHYFENQENKIRQYFEKVNKLMESNKITYNSNLNQKFKYSRLVNNNSENIADLVKLTTQNHTKNIDNMINLVQMLNQNLGKRLKNQGFSEAKLNMFLEESQRMEEVYSFTLSKVLQNLQEAKQNIQNDPKKCYAYLQNLQQITRKLYGLYPTRDSLKQIAFKIKNHDDSHKNFGVQVNTQKKMNQKKISTQSFRTQIKINECLQRFEKNAKYRKTFDFKQIQKLFQSIRENLPSKYTPSQSQLVFQEQYKRLSQASQKQQKELTESFNKKSKKLQKKIQQLQLIISQMRKKQGNINEQWQQEKNKLLKKIDGQKNDYKKLLKQKQNLQKSLNEYLLDIQHMKQSIKKKNEDQIGYRRSLQNEKQIIKQKFQSNYKKLNDLSSQYYNEKQMMNEQRSIYKQKIEFMERKISQSNQLSTGLNLELKQLIIDNSRLQNELNQMSIIYQEKIKQVQEMIDNIKQLRKAKHNQDIIIQKMNEHQRKYLQKIQALQKDVYHHLNKIQKFNEEKLQLNKQIQHWKQQGKLTDGDLKILKEEVQKVNNAYLQSQETLQNTRHELNVVSEERQRIFRQKIKLNRLVEDYQSQLHSIKARSLSLQVSERDLKDQYYQKCQQFLKTQKQNEELRRQIHNLRKQLHDQKEQRLKLDKQYREIRQQNQNRKESQSIESGKRRLEVENIRVQLRKKTQQMDKQRQNYEEKVSIMTQKMKELQQFAGQKMQLSRLLQNHQTK